MDRFQLSEAIAKSHNEAYPANTPVTAEEVRLELQMLLAIYGKFKSIQDDTPETLRIHHCSFCGKSNAQVEALLLGRGGACICNECADLCQVYFRRSN